MHTDKCTFYHMMKNRNGKSTFEILDGIFDFNIEELKIEKLLENCKMNKPMPIEY